MTQATDCMTGGTEKPFSVILCGKHPHDPNFDDAHTGEDYATLAEARAVFEAADPCRPFEANVNPGFYSTCTPYVWLLGPEDQVPGGEEIRKLPGADKMLARMRREAAEGDREWQREQACQAGMAFGCDGFNDAMGY